MNTWIYASTSPYVFVALCLIKKGPFAVLLNCLAKMMVVVGLEGGGAKVPSII
jgi:hypothetical protein